LPLRIDVDGRLGAAEDPQPGVEAADPPAGLVGVDDVALPQGFQEQVVGRSGQVGQALLGADEGGGGRVQTGVGGEEVGDLSIADAQAVFHLGGHAQDHGAEGVASGPAGIRGLLGVPSLPVLAAAGAEAGVDVEPGDEGDDGRQVGLVLDEHTGVAQGHVAGGALGKRHVDDAVDLLGRGHGAQRGRVPLGPPGLVGCAGLGFLAAERVGLAVRFSAGFVEALAEFAVVSFQLGQAADQALVLPLDGLILLVQRGQAAA
jgi:hypothetical protein